MSESQVSMADNSRKPSTEASNASNASQAKAQKTKTLGKTIFAKKKCMKNINNASVSKLAEKQFFAAEVCRGRGRLDG